MVTDTFVNDDPYGKGRLMKIEIKNSTEVNSLLNAAAYTELTGK